MSKKFTLIYTYNPSESIISCFDSDTIQPHPNSHYSVPIQATEAVGINKVYL